MLFGSWVSLSVLEVTLCKCQRSVNLFDEMDANEVVKVEVSPLSECIKLATDDPSKPWKGYLSVSSE